jgi:hypothetical protein
VKAGDPVTYVRRHVLGVTALFLVLVTTGYAASTEATAPTPKKLYACVSGNRHPLRLATAKLKCPGRQHKIS